MPIGRASLIHGARKNNNRPRLEAVPENGPQTHTNKERKTNMLYSTNESSASSCVRFAQRALEEWEEQQQREREALKEQAKLAPAAFVPLFKTGTWTTAEEQEIVRLRKAGKSWQEVADTNGRSVGSCRRHHSHMKKAGRVSC